MADQLVAAVAFAIREAKRRAVEERAERRAKLTVVEPAKRGGKVA